MGKQIRNKPGPTSEQVLKHQNFDLTRRNASEFGRAIRDAMLLRRALGSMVRAVKDPKLNSHMNKWLHKVAKSDAVSEYGSRHADTGNLQLMEGFDYNHLLSLHTALPVQLEHTMDVTTSAVQLTAPSCIVRRKKNSFPEEATHFRIVSCAGAVDFDKQRYASNIAQSGLLPLSKKMPPLQLEHSLQVQPGQVMLHSIGIVFYKVEDGEATLLRGGALKIVQVARKEKVVVPPGTGTPPHIAMRHTCASDTNKEIGVAVLIPRSHKQTRLRDYVGRRKRLCT
jgi:hypothetical protein